MGLRFIREPSDTPNVQIGDDVRAFRYAYGDQNGYIKGKGTECGYEVNGLNFIIKSGEIVINGYASEVDANGVTLTIDNIATKRYYSVYYQVNLALLSVSIMATYDTAGYPVIKPGDDLNVNIVGTARLELYRFTATNGIIDDVTKRVNAIRYANDAAILTTGLIADARIPSNIARINGTYDNLTSGTSKNAQKVNGLNLDLTQTGDVLKSGDFIMSKKKLLWQGSVNIGSTSDVTIFVHTGSLGGKKLQVETSKGIYLFNVRANGSTSITNTLLVYISGTQDFANLYHRYIRFHVEYPSLMNRLVGFCLNRRFSTGSESSESCTVTKVYEIIE